MDRRPPREFLGEVTDDSLFAFWWLAALPGLRRGELCGLRWTDIDLDRAVLTVERNRTTAGYQIVENDPKTPAGRRAVALDKHTVRVLRAHRRRQLDHRRDALAAGKVWIDSGYVFIRGDGVPINPNYATTRFRKLVQRAGLPPVRLHDLRHGAASLQLRPLKIKRARRDSNPQPSDPVGVRRGGPACKEP